MLMHACCLIKTWNAKCKIAQYGLVPNDDGTEVQTVFPYFWYPEFSESQQQVEFRTLDYTHMLTNRGTMF